MSNEIQLQDAADALHVLQQQREPMQGRARALIGDGSGNVVGNSGAPWVLCRLGGDVNQLVQAYNGTYIVPSEGMSVTLLIKYKEGRVDHYEIERLSSDVPYPGYIPGATGGTQAHHLSHEGTPGGGWDMVNVYPLNVTMLRPNAQTTPDMTVQVAAGYYWIEGVLYYFTGGSSGAFTAPGSGLRYDVLTLDSAGALNIQTGALTLPPMAFVLPTNEIPIVAVLLYAGQTVIANSDLYDVRPFFSVGGGGVTSDVLADSNADVIVDDNGDIIVT